MDTADHSPSLSHVDLISYQGSYYYAINFTYYFAGQPVTNLVWYTNSTIFCMSPQQPNSSYAACPTQPPMALSISIPAASTYAVNQGRGLELRLNLATNPLTGALTVNIQERNTLYRINNVSSSDQWAAPPEDLTGYYMGRFLGLAVYKGAVGLSSITTAKPLPLMELGSSISCSPCSPPSYYLFQPLSDNATGPPGYTFPYYSSSSVAVALNDTISGYWTSSTNFEYFPAGTYTVAAFDQWGQVSLLQFEVAA